MIAGENNALYTATSIGIYKWTAEDATNCPFELCCPVEIIAGTSCCALDAPVVTVECNDNGTPGNPSDDTFTYT